MESTLPNPIVNIPAPKRLLLDELITELSRVAGMAALVLGGSYASGTQHAASDLDIGLYYHEAAPFDLAEIRHIATAFAADGAPTVTGFYEWGAWVNGGAWIHTRAGKVDFLYRNVEHVERTIAEAQQGIVHHDYDQQPTHGFYSVIYLAETQFCIPLYDPDELIAGLKRQVEVYPPKLREKIIADSLWAAEFTLLHARGFAAQGDVYNTVGCLTRAAANLTQALFAVNGRYFSRDKQVMATLAAFPHLPADYVRQINNILACPGSTAAALISTVQELEQAWRGVVSLPGVEYRPKFHV